MRRLAVLFLGFFLLQGPGMTPGASPGGTPTIRLFSQAVRLHSLGEFEKSFAVLEQAVAAPTGGPDALRAKCLLRMGIVRWDLGDVPGSATFFESAARTFGQSHDLRSQEFCAKCLDLVRLYDRGREDRQNKLYDRSLDRWQEAWALARDIGLPDLQLKCLRQLALTHLMRGELELFLEKSRSALAVAVLINHRLEQGRCLNNLGVYYQQRMDYSQAVSYLEQARALMRSSGDGRAASEPLTNLGLVYRELGDFERGRVFLTEALERDEAGGDPNMVAMDWDNIGSVLLRQGLDEQDREALGRSLDAFQNGLRMRGSAPSDPLVAFAALNNMGVILNELGDYAEARARFDQALRLVDHGESALERSHVLANIAAAYLSEQEISQARTYFRAAYELSEKNAYANVLMDSCLGLGKCCELTGQDETALEFYEKAIRTLEGVKAQLPEPLLIGFARNKFEAYDRAIHIWAGRYDRSPSEAAGERVFDLVERARARAFLESLAEARTDLSGPDLRRIQERQRAISRNLADLSAKLNDPSLSGNEKRDVGHEIQCEEEESVRLSAELKDPGTSRTQAWDRAVRSLKEIQALLHEERAVLLEYALGDPSSYLIVISSTSLRLYRLPAQEDLERSLRAYLRSLSDHSLDARLGYAAAERIGRQLLPFLGDETIRQAGTLIIVPDGILNALPFEALRVPGRTGTSYLIEGPSVSYCPSASALATLQGRARPRTWAKQVLAVGSPNYSTELREPDRGPWPQLPFSRKEAQAVVRGYPARAVDILNGSDVSEGAIKSWPLRDYRIIHFACHGFLDEKVPLRSALALSAGNGTDEDGLLQMREIYGLSLSADLVVLSACQTGIGRIEKSEGSLALARPFFFAGARAVVASLWSIGDRSTVPFMREFYRRLSEGWPAAEALREAKLSLLRSRWSHPFYWAAFLLQGDPSAAGSPKGT